MYNVIGEVNLLLFMPTFTNFVISKSLCYRLVLRMFVIGLSETTKNMYLTMWIIRSIEVHKVLLHKINAQNRDKYWSPPILRTLTIPVCSKSVDIFPLVGYLLSFCTRF